MTVTQTYPTRFRAAPRRSARIGRMLRLAGRVADVDEDLMARLGSAFTQRDELGARLAQAMRADPGDPNRVTMAQFRTALADGLDAVPDASPSLKEFFEAVETDPPWLDRDLVEEGAHVMRRFGRSAADVLLQLSLIGGYRFGGPPDLLVATGGLTGDSARRRLAETQAWTLAVGTPGELALRAEGWRLTVHVRAMHALVNHSLERRWDVERWGLPINQADQAGTLGLFDGALLIGVRALGVPVSRRESRAVMHLWKYVGWLMGVDEQWLVDTERERQRVNYHVVLAQGPISDAGPQLAQDLIAVLDQLPHPRWKTERNLSMLSVFLGWRSMRDLGLPWRPGWAFALAIGSNLVRHQIVRRLPGGVARIERSGAAVADRILADFSGSAAHSVGALPGVTDSPVT